MSSANSLSSPAAEADLYDIQVGKYFFLAGLSVLLWEHICTFPDEVRTVWKRKKTFALYLFLVIRYYALAAFTIIAFGYFSLTMTVERCAKWMLFLPLGITMPLSLMPGIVMLIRTYALYNRNKAVLIGFSVLMVAQFCIGIWIYTIKGGTPAPDPLQNYEYHFCIYLPNKKIGNLNPIYVTFELGYETLIFLLTVARTSYMHRKYELNILGRGGGGGRTLSLMRCFVRDGALYYAAIFALNLMWALMILHAPTGLRAIASMPASCITVVIVSRISLNMRMHGVDDANAFERTRDGIPLEDMRFKTRPGHSGQSHKSLPTVQSQRSLPILRAQDPLEEEFHDGQVKLSDAW